MKHVHFVVSVILVVCVCGRSYGQLDTSVSLTQARQGFKTKPTALGSVGQAVPTPPPGVFQVVRYKSPAGKLAAYLTPDPKDGKKHPAIIWIHGGNCNSIREYLWHAAPASNDQTAAAYRKAGITMMFPSLRGGNDNPGVREGFFGEVDDVLAAAEYLSQQAFVDPQRIYLGGHSTGATLVLLVAECSDRFRDVFSFEPVISAAMHMRENVPFDTSSKREVELRAPILWLHSIKAPVFVFAGTKSYPGNIQSLQAMAKVSKNSVVHFLAVKGANHSSASRRHESAYGKQSASRRWPSNQLDGHGRGTESLHPVISGTGRPASYDGRPP